MINIEFGWTIKYKKKQKIKQYPFFYNIKYSKILR